MYSMHYCIWYAKYNQVKYHEFKIFTLDSVLRNVLRKPSNYLKCTSKLNEQLRLTG